jgi:SSS family solute:Na+ symporter
MVWFLKLSLLDLLVFFLILLFSFAFLLWRRFNQSSGTSVLEYMVMGRTLTLPMFITTLVATWYSGIFGVTQISFEHGIYNLVTQGIFWYLAAALFALFFVNRVKASSALSLAEYIRHTYGKNSAFAAAVLIFFKTLPIPYAIALGLFLNGFFGLELSSAISIGMFFAAFYCLKGGMRATVLSDVLQFIAMFSAISAVVVVSFSSFGGISYLQTNLPTSHFSIQGNHNMQTVVLWLLVALSTTLLSPVFYQKCLAAKSNKIARSGIMISIIFWVASDILTTLAGMYAKAALPDADPANAFMNYAVDVLPSGLRGFFMASIFITVFSAIDSYLFLSSSVIAYDLFRKLAHKTSSRNYCIIVTAMLTVVASNFFHRKIEEVWLFTESFFLASMLVPLILPNILPNKISDRGIMVSIIFTIIAMTLWLALGGAPIIEPFYIGLLTNTTVLFCLFIYSYFKPLKVGNS